MNSMMKYNDIVVYENNIYKKKREVHNNLAKCRWILHACLKIMQCSKKSSFRVDQGVSG